MRRSYFCPCEPLEQLIHHQQEAIMALTLPQQDLPVFDGDPLEYSDFIRAFENNSWLGSKWTTQKERGQDGNCKLRSDRPSAE